MRGRYKLLILLLSMAAIAGCGRRTLETTEPQTQSQTQLQPQTFQQITEEQTDEPTEVQTEPQTEKMLSVKEIQVKTTRSQRSGTLQYEVVDNEGSKSETMSFQATPSEFYAENDSTKIYSGKKKSAFDNGGGWKKSDAEFSDIWEEIYSTECSLSGKTEINEKNCYHLVEYSEEIGGYFMLLAQIEDYEDIISGDARIDYYVDPDTFEIVRTNITTEFQGMIDDKSKNGHITAVFNCSNADSISITEPIISKPSPQTEDEFETEESYDKGSISLYNNNYKNQLFDLQITGKEAFSFDQDKTDEIANGYKESSSSYTEEAYARSDMGILNIVSIASRGKSAEEMLDKYMSDSAASAIQSAGKFEIGNTTYICSMADINETKTKTYCTTNDERALIITLYYNSEDTISAFEENVYRYNEDPFWEKETWTLLGALEVSTPNGYKIITADSGDLFVCMKSSRHEINVFALPGTSVEAEVERETKSTDSESKELIADDYIEEDGIAYRYIVVKTVDNSGSYYSYIGLYDVGGVTVKCYMVSTSGEDDLKDAFSKFAANTRSLNADAQEQSETTAE